MEKAKQLFFSFLFLFIWDPNKKSDTNCCINRIIKCEVSTWLEIHVLFFLCLKRCLLGELSQIKLSIICWVTHLVRETDKSLTLKLEMLENGAPMREGSYHIGLLWKWTILRGSESPKWDEEWCYIALAFQNKEKRTNWHRCLTACCAGVGLPNPQAWATW